MHVARIRTLSFVLGTVALLIGCADQELHSESAPQDELVDAWQEADTLVDRLTVLLPGGDRTAEIMQLMMQKREAELLERVFRNMKERPFTALGKVLSSESGQPLPYDPIMGITEEEYAELLEIAGNWTLQKVGDAIVPVSADDSGLLAIRLPSGGTEDVVLKLDLNSGAVQTSFGGLSEPSEFSASERQKVTGPWNGYHWKTGSVGSLISGKQIELYVGQLVTTRQAVIMYRVRDLYQSTDLVDVAIYLEPPISRSGINRE